MDSFSEDMCRVDSQIFSWRLHYFIQIIVLAACLQKTGGFACKWPLARVKFASVWLSHQQFQRIFQTCLFYVVSELLLIVLLLIPKLLIYLVARRQSKVPISSIAGFLLMKKNINFVAKALKILNIKIVVKRDMV